MSAILPEKQDLRHRFMLKTLHQNEIHMDVDKPGKDSYELRKAGASQTIVASKQRWALMTEAAIL
jgi:molybdopterin-guanine dinucleotide biosynthesis protein B